MLSSLILGDPWQRRMSCLVLPCLSWILTTHCFIISSIVDFTFDECPNQTSPTIGMRLGETYTFNQAHRTNYFHPIGFAYYADGAHDDVDELEPGITPPGSSTACADALSCPAPMYFRNGTYLGTYSNIPDVANVTTEEDNFGLDDYEPLFFRPIPEWAGFGDFEVKLRFDVDDFTQDVFYFCHVSTCRDSECNAIHWLFLSPDTRLHTFRFINS